MAKRKFRASRAFKIPLAMTAGLAGTILGSSHHESTLDFLMKADYKSAVIRIIQNLTGYHLTDKTWSIENSNLMPLVVGTVVSICASKFGVNRRLAALGLPIKL